MSSQEALRQYAEDVALCFEQVGMTRSAGRILGWLLIAKPPHQSMTEIVEALQVSKSSVSTATRTLLQFGFIERISLPGIRQDYYRMTEGIWKNSIRQQSEQASVMRNLADRGLEIIADQPAEQKERLQEMRDLYAFIEEEIPLILERWEKRQQLSES